MQHGLVPARPDYSVDDEWLQLTTMWLHGRPESTRSVYMPEVQAFRQWLGPSKRLGEVTLMDLQRYIDELTSLSQKPRTICRKAATLKSLLTFVHKIGAIPFNAGAALKLPAVPSDLAEKILTEEQIARVIRGESNKRNRVLLGLLYAAGLRASEAATLRWVDATPRKDGGQISVLGKGLRRRSIRLPEDIWQALASIHPKNAEADEPIFSRDDGGPMNRTSIAMIVSRAAKRVGLAHVSPHFFRHAHATHSLDRGAPLPLIASTLGHQSIQTTTRYLHIRPEDSSSRFLRAWKKGL